MADAGSPGREGATALAKQSSVIAGAAGIGSDRAGRFVEGPIAGEASREKVDRSGRALGRASDAGGGNGDGLRGTNEGGGGIKAGRRDGADNRIEGPGDSSVARAGHGSSELLR